MKTKNNIGLFFMYAAVALVITGLVHTRWSGTLPHGYSQADRTGVFTAYSAEVAQTDSSPSITASNVSVREGIIANNCLPFGTRIRVHGKVYEVQDRMHDRYGCDNFDIYMTDYSRAVSFGKQPLRYEII
jgi:3D (Asp-Asp-Asp) domain-containing protein